MSIAKGSLIAAADINNHINNKNNPHEVMSDDILISNNAASNLGLSNNLTIDQALNALQQNNTSYSNQYYWKRRLYDKNLALEIFQSKYTGNWLYNEFGTPSDITITYSSSVSVSGSSISMPNSSNITLYYNRTYTSPYPLNFRNYDDVINKIKGKYIKINRSNYPNIYYCDNNIAFTGKQVDDSEGYPRTTITPSAGCFLCSVGNIDSSGAWETVSSNSASTYPRIGRLDDYEYFFNGIPKENALLACSCFVGEYLGLNGIQETNTINLPVTPLFIVIRKKDESNGNNTFFWFYSYNNNVPSGTPNITVGNNSFSITGSVGNVANTIYSYFAIGTT